MSKREVNMFNVLDTQRGRYDGLQEPLALMQQRLRRLAMSIRNVEI